MTVEDIAQSPDAQREASELASYVGIGEKVLNKKFYPKQKECLIALHSPGSLVSFCSCNGGGKTTEVIVTAIVAHLVLCRGKVIVTSGSYAQLKDQLMPSLKCYDGKMGLRVLEDRIETVNPNCFMHAISTNDSGKFEGHHGSEESPLLLIYDESKTVKNMFFEAGDRCRLPRKHCRILYASSTGFAQGVFYLSQTDKSFGLTHPPIRQKASECPHISSEEIEGIRLKWGKDHPLTKSMLDCEFMPFVQGAIVQLNELDALLADPPQFVQGERKLFFDAAWSESGAGDETCLASRNGNRIRIESCFRERGLHATAGRLVSEFVRLGLRQDEADIIEGDNGGEGSLLIDQLHAMGWRVGRCNNGDKPRYNDRYGNLVSEMWVDGAMDITQRKFILPSDTDLYGQMLNRRLVPNNKGLLVIESKQAMRDPNREGGAVRCSPDRADAVFGAMARLNRVKPAIFGTAARESWRPSQTEISDENLAEAQRLATGHRF